MKRGFLFGAIFALFAVLCMGAMNLYTYSMQQAVNKLAVDHPQAGQLWMDDGDDNRDSLIVITPSASEYSFYSEATGGAPCTFTVYYTIADTANSFTILSDGHTYSYDQGPACDSVDVDRSDAAKYATFTYTY
jgi:hypothetical protein